MKTSLTKFCRDHDLPKSTVDRWAQELQIDTSKGLTPDAYVQQHKFDVETGKMLFVRLASQRFNLNVTCCADATQPPSLRVTVLQGTLPEREFLYGSPLTPFSCPEQTGQAR